MAEANLFFGEPSRGRKQMDQDKYCWFCHKIGPLRYCVTCPRSYHATLACSQSKDLSEMELANWICPECRHIEKGAEYTNAMKIDAAHLRKVLNYLLNLLASKKILSNAFMNVEELPRGTIVNTLDISTINNKVVLDAYSCCEEFLADLKWIAHNAKSMNKDKSAANALQRFIKEEQYMIDLCPECYVNLDGNWFEVPCKFPHLIVWAKQRTFPYWPAKLLRFNSKEKTVDVRYFGGDYLRAVLPVKNCLLYSRKNPSVTIRLHKLALESAEKEAERYIGNLIKRYGVFNYAQPMTIIDGDMLDRHLYDTVPNAWKALGNIDIPPPVQTPLAKGVGSERRMSVPALHDTDKNLTPTRVMTRRSSVMVPPTHGAKRAADSKGTAKNSEPSAKMCRLQNILGETIPQTGTFISGNIFVSSDSSNGTPFKVPPIPPLRSPSTSPPTMLIPVEELSDFNMVTEEYGYQPMNETPIIKKQPVKKQPVTKQPITKQPVVKQANTKQTIKKQTVMKPSVVKQTVTMQNIKPKKRVANDKLNEVSLKIEKPKEPPMKRARMLDMSMVLTQSNSIHTAEMVAMCDAVAERNTKKMHEVIRSSLAESLYDLLDTTKAEKRIHEMNAQMETQNKNHSITVNGMQIANRNMKAALHEARVKVEKLTAQLNELQAKNAEDMESQLTDLQEKCDQTTDELEIALEQIDELNSKVATITAKNKMLQTSANQLRDVNTELSQLKETNAELSNSLMTVENRNNQLTVENENQLEEIAKLNDSVDNLNSLNEKISTQLKMVEDKNEQDTEDTIGKYKKMVQEAKMKQWCAMCLTPGGKYFCSPSCEKHFTNPEDLEI